MATFKTVGAAGRHQIAGLARRRMETVIRAAVLETATRIIERSPVDTGRFRANWVVSASDQPDLSTTEDTDSAPVMTAINERALSLQIGEKFVISNSLPYAYRLEYGWSQQAPNGMVRLAATDFRAIVQDAIRQSQEVS